MKIFAFLCLLTVSLATSGQSISKKKRAEKEIIKQYAVVTCLSRSMDLYFKTDSNELSMGNIEELFDRYRINSRSLASIKSDGLRQAEKLKPDTGADIAQWSVGKNFYIIGCLTYYNSSRLDSLVGSLKRSSYIYNDLKMFK